MPGIVGVGIDLVDVDRFRTSLQRTPSMRERMFTPGERAYAESATDPTERYAARFAAKEAVMTALGVGLGISFIAGVFYVVAWEAVQAISGMDFPTAYSNAMVESAKAKGESAEAIAKMTAEMAAFKVQYADPLFRLPMTFAEIFPVGVLVSLVSAALLRKPRVLPARG